jgi:predicted ribosome quality control (RQC) complex YloA/Tae2 family protein
MHSSYHTLRAVALDISGKLNGCQITEVYSQERDEAVFAFAGLAAHLVVSCRTDLLCCYLHTAFARARKNSADVLPAAPGSLVQDVSVDADDREIRFALSGGKTLHLQFFGAKANMLVVDASGTILSAFKRSRDLVGQTLPPIKAHAAPTAQGITLAIRTLAQSALGSALKRCAPQFAPVIVREILYRAGLPAEFPVTMMPEESYTRLTDAVSSVMAELTDPHPRIYSAADGTPLHFSLIPLLSLTSFREDHYDDIHTALRTFVGWKRSTESITGERRSLERRLRQRFDHARRIVAAIDVDQAGEDRVEQYARFGSLLLQHLNDIATGSAATTVESPDGPVTIPLAPAQTASQNAQRYFEKAKASKRAHQLAEGRRAFYVARTERSATLLAELERITLRQELKKFMEQHRDELHDRPGNGPADDNDRPLFREFIVEGGFEVWAGKTSANNDALTLRHARPQDYWFHARGVPGSHVILRVATGRGEPGKRAIRQAASIAAYYSKMRTASLVPVAVTLRKYVHKPKGAKAGSVVLQREDVIMVEPVLPHQIEDNDE